MDLKPPVSFGQVKVSRVAARLGRPGKWNGIFGQARHLLFKVKT